MYNNIGLRIRDKRIELGMTQDELAQKMGYKTRSSIAKIETTRDMPLKKVAQFAKVLGVTPTYLMGWEDNLSIDNADVTAAILQSADWLQLNQIIYGIAPDKRTEVISKLIDYADFVRSR